jgi:pimeloyl-ACP methyl ester carboxylesterase
MQDRTMPMLNNLSTYILSKRFLIPYFLGILTVSLIMLPFFKPLTRKVFNVLRRDAPAKDANLNSKSLPGTFYETSIPPETIDTYLAADYRLWIPAETSLAAVKGILVVQHGCSGTGLDYANDLEWQSLAAKHHFALLGTHLATRDKPCEYWALINYGSGKAFFKALDQFAAKSQHPELKTVPWVLWGYSGGADWSAQMLQQYPERTIAMVGARCGGFTFFGVNPTLLNLPVLFSVGERDPNAAECVELPKTVFHKYRSAGALWTFAVEADTGHELGRSQDFILSYLDAMIPLRLSADNHTLRPVDPSDSWLGNLTTYKIESIRDYKENPREATWFPNESIARQWQQHVQNTANSAR